MDHVTIFPYIGMHGIHQHRAFVQLESDQPINNGIGLQSHLKPSVKNPNPFQLQSLSMARQAARSSKDLKH